MYLNCVTIDTIDLRVKSTWRVGRKSKLPALLFTPPLQEELGREGRGHEKQAKNSAHSELVILKIYTRIKLLKYCNRASI